MPGRLSTVIALVVAVAAPAAAQQITPPAGQLAQPDQAPPPGTATLRGHVFAGDTGQALRKAQVRIFAPDVRENRMVTTDANGAYEFTEVRPGRYTVNVSKGSYVSMSYGQARTTDAPKPLEIQDREIVERLDFSLARGGVITGRIVDEFGEPMPEIAVAAERYQFVRGRRTLTTSGRPAQTNDIGEFRLFGVPPGQYYVTATWRSNGSNPGANPNDRTAYPPMYFPGTTDAAEAQRITIAAGQELNDLVMMLRPIKAARITGTATGVDGKPMVPAIITVTQFRGFGFSMSSGAPVRPDGTFTVNNLAPGEYTLRVSRNGPPSDDGPEFASAKVVVAGEDIQDLHLVASRASVATGRIVVDPATAPQLPTPLVLSVFPLEFDGAPPPPPARVGDDLTFTIKSAPGNMRVSLNLTGAGPRAWTVRSVRVNGADVTDAGIEFKPNQDISNVEIELTNKVTTVSGLVTDGRGDPAKDYTAIVFSQDKDRWGPNTRYQGIGRPDQDGRFKISSLPPGEYYVIAVDRIEAGQSSDPEFLESVRSRASTLSLMEGETRTIDLKLNTSS